MNLKQIREEAWDIARETAIRDSDRLWSTKEMNRYINRIYRLIARETKCIRDAITPSITQIPSVPVDYTTFTPGTEDYRLANDINSWIYHTDVAPYIYPLDPLILDIDEIKWTERAWRLTKVSVSKWQVNPFWEQVLGMPTEYATDYSNGVIALNFRSDSADTLRLIVRRMPLKDLIADADIPEFRTHYHDFMINGILWQMYSKQDAETFDGVKAVDYKTMWLSDLDEIKQQETILDQRLRVNFSMNAFR